MGTPPLANSEMLPALRVLTCGSVDDGKSTLIGRLLYEQKLIFDDHFAALEYDSIAPAPFRACHGRLPVSKLTAPCLRGMAGSRIDARWLTGGKSGNRWRHVGGIPFAKCR